MKILYIDESGGSEPWGTPSCPSHATPVLVIGGVVLDHRSLPLLTKEYNDLKRRFYPGKIGLVRPGHSLDCMLAEIKGAEVRKWYRDADRQKARQASVFLGEVVRLLTRHGAKVLARVWVKPIGIALKPHATYGYSVQDIARHFEHLLHHGSDLGLMICDSRHKRGDVVVSHSIFTQKHQIGGDAYPSLVDTAVFGRSDNHVGLQLADLVVAGLLFPMALSAFQPAYVTTVTNGARFHNLRATHGATLKSLRYVYRDGAGMRRGGVVISDPVNMKALPLFP